MKHSVFLFFLKSLILSSYSSNSSKDSNDNREVITLGINNGYLENPVVN